MGTDGISHYSWSAQLNVLRDSAAIENNTRDDTIKQTPSSSSSLRLGGTPLQSDSVLYDAQSSGEKSNSVNTLESRGENESTETVNILELPSVSQSSNSIELKSEKLNRMATRIDRFRGSAEIAIVGLQVQEARQEIPEIWTKPTPLKDNSYHLETENNSPAPSKKNLKGITVRGMEKLTFETNSSSPITPSPSEKRSLFREGSFKREPSLKRELSLKRETSSTPILPDDDVTQPILKGFTRASISIGSSHPSIQSLSHNISPSGSCSSNHSLSDNATRNVKGSVSIQIDKPKISLADEKIDEGRDDREAAATRQLSGKLPKTKQVPLPIKVNFIPHEDSSPLTAIIDDKNRFNLNLLPLVGNLESSNMDTTIMTSPYYKSPAQVSPSAYTTFGGDLLPTFLKGLKFAFDQSIPKDQLRILSRHVIAYDGYDTLANHRDILAIASQEATHFCTLNIESQIAKDVKRDLSQIRVIDADWILSSHRRKGRLDEMAHKCID